ncbi:hypothetical protein OR1_02348 [Geobacter sp. OR-1]|nr:hypothetical protein OR1_02348 [Geobacter sp. OR-1]
MPCYRLCSGPPDPGRVKGFDLGGVNKGLVLNDQGDLIGWNRPGSVDPAIDSAAVDKSGLYRILDEVAGSLAGIDIQAGDPVGMVVIKHQPGALLVCIVIGDCTGAGVVACTGAGIQSGAGRNHISRAIEPHVRHVLDIVGLRKWRYLV